MRIAVLGAGAGAAATAVELISRGHDITLWNRSLDTLIPFQKSGGIRYDGVLGDGLAKPTALTTNLHDAVHGSDGVVIALPTFSHGPLAGALATAKWPAERPVILNPGHTGGALEFETAFRAISHETPSVAEFSTLTYVARKYAPDCVTVSGRAGKVRVAGLPGSEAALSLASTLFPGVERVQDVLASDLANVNMVLHPPAAVLGSLWVEARGGDFTFYVEGMTPGVARTMRKLDDERRTVARAFGHDLPNLIEEMMRIGTVDASVVDVKDFAAAISAGEANRRIMAPNTFDHRYYREDFGHGLLPFLELAAIAGIDTPVARSLLTIAETMTGTDYRQGGRTAGAMGIAGMSKDELQERVRK